MQGVDTESVLILMPLMRTLLQGISMRTVILRPKMEMKKNSRILILQILSERPLYEAGDLSSILITTKNST